MPIIEMSQGYYNGNYKTNLVNDHQVGPQLTFTPFNMGLFGQTSTTYPVNDDYEQSTIALMKGSKPTDFSTITFSGNPGVPSRNSDVLVAWSRYTGAGSVNPSTLLVDFTTNIWQISTLFAPASASGTATWFFYWLSTPVFGSAYYGIKHMFMGTVGAFGSGADLELQTTNIVSGTNYKITNLTFDIPLTWSY